MARRRYGDDDLTWLGDCLHEDDRCCSLYCDARFAVPRRDRTPERGDGDQSLVRALSRAHGRRELRLHELPAMSRDAGRQRRFVRPEPVVPAVPTARELRAGAVAMTGRISLFLGIAATLAASPQPTA